ncbi:translocation and assembly module TamA [Halopseudomonas sabulinigri]|uniref:Translocation and assembly module subunit TamA n=1 Tax=Halopseudomonas sabulinigri TaxID=472181 RepID=A0A1H1MB70_9GAMM|nr:autotransporter assembly complex family protein [Halopseudomonas sabulinigri]SDR84051.1 translocation and assembly module TamA [Halopseudomonas sabulinigri]
MVRFTPPLALLLLAPTAWADLEVQVEPAKRAVKENIEAYIGPVEAGSREELRRLFDHADEQATLAAQALGYYHTRNYLHFAGTEDDPTLIIKVDLGSPVRLNDISIDIQGEGKGTDAFALTLPENFAPGKRLNHGDYESIKTQISNRALQYGYFSGQYLQHQLRVNPDANQADVDIAYLTGPRYKLGEVTYSQTLFSEDLLDRFIPFEPGVPYDAELIGQFNQDLLSSGYFNGVQVLAPADKAVENVIPVEVTLSERDPHSLGFGGGFSTDVGVRTKATWDQHWLNPQGHSRGASAELSKPRQEVSAFYQVPLDPPLTSSLRYFLGWQHEDIDDVETRSLAAGAELRKRLDSGWERTLGLRVQNEIFSLGDDSGTSTLLIPSLAMQRTKTSGGVDPAKGYSLLFDVQGAKKGLISTVDFARVMGQAKGLYTLFDRHRLLGRLQLGALATNDFSNIPPSLRFFAGGDQSIRGYAYQTLSPVDSTGETVGARYLMTSTAEYQYEFIDRWRAATFVDYGNAVDSPTDPLKTSVGLGVRWVSPIGPLRVDVARSLSDPDEGFRIHFSMGPDL